MQRSAIADTICRTIELGVTITDAALDGEDRTHLFCEVLAPKSSCPRCERAGRLRDHVDREVADLPIVGHPTRLHLRAPRYACENGACGQGIFRADISAIVAPHDRVDSSADDSGQDERLCGRRVGRVGLEHRECPRVAGGAYGGFGAWPTRRCQGSRC